MCLFCKEQLDVIIIALMRLFGLNNKESYNLNLVASSHHGGGVLAYESSDFNGANGDVPAVCLKSVTPTEEKRQDYPVTVHSLHAEHGGGILDLDDRIGDLVDDKEQILAIFDESDRLSGTGYSSATTSSSVDARSTDLHSRLLNGKLANGSGATVSTAAMTNGFPSSVASVISSNYDDHYSARSSPDPFAPYNSGAFVKNGSMRGSRDRRPLAPRIDSFSKTFELNGIIDSPASQPSSSSHDHLGSVVEVTEQNIHTPVPGLRVEDERSPRGGRGSSSPPPLHRLNGAHYQEPLPLMTNGQLPSGLSNTNRSVKFSANDTSVVSHQRDPSESDRENQPGQKSTRFMRASARQSCLNEKWIEAAERAGERYWDADAESEAGREEPSPDYSPVTPDDQHPLPPSLTRPGQHHQNSPVKHLSQQRLLHITLASERPLPLGAKLSAHYHKVDIYKSNQNQNSSLRALQVDFIQTGGLFSKGEVEVGDYITGINSMIVGTDLLLFEDAMKFLEDLARFNKLCTLQIDRVNDSAQQTAYPPPIPHRPPPNILNKTSKTNIVTELQVKQNPRSLPPGISAIDDDDDGAKMHISADIAHEVPIDAGQEGGPTSSNHTTSGPSSLSPEESTSSAAGGAEKRGGSPSNTSANTNVTKQSTLQKANTRKIGRKMDISLVKSADGLGFSVTTRDTLTGGDAPIYVKNILARGAAIVDGQLKSGDRILEINRQAITGLSQPDVVKILRGFKTGDSVELVISRQEFTATSTTTSTSPVLPRELPSDKKAVEDNEEMDSRQKELLSFEIALNDTGSAGLGVSVKGRTSEDRFEDLGIFIKSMMHGGAAKKDGRLHTNDQLVSINNQQLLGHLNSEAMTIVRNAMQELSQDAISIKLSVLRVVDNQVSYSKDYEDFGEITSYVNNNKKSQQIEGRESIGSPDSLHLEGPPGVPLFQEDAGPKKKSTDRFYEPGGSTRASKQKPAVGVDGQRMVVQSAYVSRTQNDADYAMIVKDNRPRPLHPSDQRAPTVNLPVDERENQTLIVHEDHFGDGVNSRPPPPYQKDDQTITSRLSGDYVDVKKPSTSTVVSSKSEPSITDELDEAGESFVRDAPTRQSMSEKRHKAAKNDPTNSLVYQKIKTQRQQNAPGGSSAQETDQLFLMPSPIVHPKSLDRQVRGITNNLPVPMGNCSTFPTTSTPTGRGFTTPATGPIPIVKYRDRSLIANETSDSPNPDGGGCGDETGLVGRNSVQFSSNMTKSAEYSPAHPAKPIRPLRPSASFNSRVSLSRLGLPSFSWFGRQTRSPSRRRSALITGVNQNTSAMNTTNIISSSGSPLVAVRNWKVLGSPNDLSPIDGVPSPVVGTPIYLDKDKGVMRRSLSLESLSKHPDASTSADTNQDSLIVEMVSQQQPQQQQQPIVNGTTSLPRGSSVFGGGNFFKHKNPKVARARPTNESFRAAVDRSVTGERGVDVSNDSTRETGIDVGSSASPLPDARASSQQSEESGSIASREFKDPKRRDRDRRSSGGGFVKSLLKLARGQSPGQRDALSDSEQRYSEDEQAAKRLQEDEKRRIQEQLERFKKRSNTTLDGGSSGVQMSPIVKHERSHSHDSQTGLWKNRLPPGSPPLRPSPTVDRGDGSGMVLDRRRMPASTIIVTSRSSGGKGAVKPPDYPPPSYEQLQHQRGMKTPYSHVSQSGAIRWSPQQTRSTSSSSQSPKLSKRQQTQSPARGVMYVTDETGRHLQQVTTVGGSNSHGEYEEKNYVELYSNGTTATTTPNASHFSPNSQWIYRSLERYQTPQYQYHNNNQEPQLTGAIPRYQKQGPTATSSSITTTGSTHHQTIMANSQSQPSGLMQSNSKRHPPPLHRDGATSTMAQSVSAPHNIVGQYPKDRHRTTSTTPTAPTPTTNSSSFMTNSSHNNAASSPTHRHRQDHRSNIGLSSSSPVSKGLPSTTSKAVEQTVINSSGTQAFFPDSSYDYEQHLRKKQGRRLPSASRPVSNYVDYSFAKSTSVGQLKGGGLTQSKAFQPSPLAARMPAPYIVDQSGRSKQTPSNRREGPRAEADARTMSYVQPKSSNDLHWSTNPKAYAVHM